MQEVPPFFGNNLKEEIHKSPDTRPPIIEGLLYEKSILMVAADPGCGKSVITLCAIAQMSCGMPVFNSFVVPRPMKCYYIPSERGKEEAMERLKHMEKVIPIDYNNIFIDDQLIGVDVTDPVHADHMLKRIAKYCKNPNMIALDPIYGFVRGGLSKDEPASAFCRFSARMQNELGCSNWLNHHTTKTSYNTDGAEITKQDSFYGSQWLKAHVTASYHLKRSSGGVILENKKDSHSNLMTSIPLLFDSESYTCSLNSSDKMTAKDLAMIFIRNARHTKKTFTLDALNKAMGGVGTDYTRKILCIPPFDTSLINLSPLGSKALYEVTKDI